MNVEDIELFLAVYHYGSISKAAAALYMNQSNLSSKIQKIEKEIGAQLFIRGRGRHTIELTVQGEKFLEVALQLQNSFRQIDQLKVAPKKEFISVGASEVTNLFTLVPFYQKFIKEHPNIALSIHTYHSSEIYNKITQNSFDVGIVNFQKSFYDIKATPIYDEPMFLITPHTSNYYNGISPKELPADKELFIRWNETFASWHEKYWGNRNYYARVSNASDLQFYMDEKDMWSIISLNMALQLAKTNPFSIYSLSEQPPKLHYYLAEKLNKYRSLAVEEFTKELYTFIRSNINIEPKI